MYYSVRALSSIWYIDFSTHAAAGGAVAFSATIEAADFDVYKNGSATQRTSTAGFTISETFDSVTGAHQIAIDMSDNTDAGFYSAGAHLKVLLSPDETVDSQTVVKWIGSCDLETNGAATVRLYQESKYPNLPTISTTTGNTTGRINFTDVVDAQVADGDLVSSTWFVWDQTNGQWVDVVFVSIESARLANVVLIADQSVMDFTVAAGDRLIHTGWNALKAVVPGRTLDIDADSDLPWNADWDAEVESEVDDALGGGTGTALTAIPWNAAWDAEVESEVDDALGGGTGTALTAIPWNAAWDAEVESEVDDALGGGTGTALTAIPWNAAWDAEVQSEVDDSLNTAISELGVAAPTATPTVRTALMLIYMALRNKLVVQTSGTDAIEFYNDAGTLIWKKLITDDGSDYTEAEGTSG